MGTEGSHWSEGVQKLVVWLGGLLPFERVQEVVERAAGLYLSTTSIWRVIQKKGEGFRQLERSTGRWKRVQREHIRVGGRPPRMGCSMDGGMIHIRGEGWKELKVGAIFEVELRPEVEHRTGETIELAHAVSNSYVAHLGGPEVFGEKLWAEAQARGWEQAWETIVIGDGAPWIWNLTRTHFYDSKQVVDWYHATEHLAQVAHLLYGEDEPVVEAWLKKWKTTLYQGHAGWIAAMLTQEAAVHPQLAEGLLQEAHYFQQNQHRMAYMEMREEGWPIGSGTVESGCKQYKHRFTGPGMRWSREGAERLLPIRTAIMSQRFDAMWQLLSNSPPNY